MKLALTRDMSKPRQVLAGKTRLLTRRVIERRYFMVPTKAVNQLIEYLLALGCKRYGIKLVAVYVASNHYHIQGSMIHDPPVADRGDRGTSAAARTP